MSNIFSLILDLSRFFAALLVFISHAEQRLAAEFLSPFAMFGHDAVIFFFILSGFVIGYVSHYKEKSCRSYAIARLARLYSVALPSIVLVLCLNIIGNNYFSTQYDKVSAKDWVEIIISSLLFLNQSDWFRVGVPENGPYWSVCYEAWYYILFGIAFYIKGFLKYLFLLLAVVIAGKGVIILMPLWILGFMLFKYQHFLHVSRCFGFLLIVASLALYIFIRYTNFDDYLYILSVNFFGGDDAAHHELLGWGSRFLPDYLIAILFGSLFTGLYIVQDLFKFLGALKNIVRILSSYTFSLYLYHMPIMMFLSAFIDSSRVVIVLTLLCVILLGRFSEQKKASIKYFFERVVVARESLLTKE